MKSPVSLGEGHYFHPCVIPTLPPDPLWCWAAGLQDGMCQLRHRPGGCRDRVRALAASALPFSACLLPCKAPGMWQERLRLRIEPFPTLTVRLDTASLCPRQGGSSSAGCSTAGPGSCPVTEHPGQITSLLSASVPYL